MKKRPKKTQNLQSELQDFVVVAFAKDIEQAKDYETLLKNDGIPVAIIEQNEESMSDKGIAVMVPEDFLDEAHVVVESQDAYDDFYDSALEDEEDSDFDSGLLEDEL